MTNQHPITPPPELVYQWVENAIGPDYEQVIATQAARWGANIELEACVEWLGDAPVVYNDNGDLHPGSYLRDARRPTPPSLKEQALKALDDISIASFEQDAANTIRYALEQLDD